jgi:RimJ/RimL family protein N-acetyltransferase
MQGQSMKIIFETERLIFREFEITDTDFILRLLNSPGWLEFIGDRNVKTMEAAQDYLREGPIKSYNTNGFGLWLVSLKIDRSPIGMCGLIRREGLEDVDIGFAFLPEYTGYGYAFEIASATMDYARISLRLGRILAITNPDNIRSIKLLKKIGLRFTKNIRLTENAEELMLFDSS